MINNSSLNSIAHAPFMQRKGSPKNENSVIILYYKLADFLLWNTKEEKVF